MPNLWKDCQRRKETILYGKQLTVPSFVAFPIMIQYDLGSRKRTHIYLEVLKMFETQCNDVVKWLSSLHAQANGKI